MVTSANVTCFAASAATVRSAERPLTNRTSATVAVTSAPDIPGGEIQVTTKISHAGAVLSVANSGQVIPPAEVDRLFQPFQRLGPRPARPDGHGHGLGLSIVRASASAHAATVTAKPRPGGGLATDVTFPRHAVPAPLLASSQGAAKP